ncbi:heavy-metal-associated domain-containing protein [Phormidium sp. CCY1219]|uniref:heavy-metal-associated domain-containing protein n=1 Tax=Phormidium sp. CCY1219 TaxID=2886104 RepID=UPI002D1E8481|nr:heavy metal-associated domain-containing protein [Phormidium sp. CCY1219]MEB3828379.1 heavy-metal-associated domain-containing protein [Phormidium sp. CCY1219]
MAVKLNVPSMVCESCVEKVTDALKTVDADAKVNVDLSSKQVTIDSEASPESFEQAITAAGYQVNEV